MRRPGSNGVFSSRPIEVDLAPDLAAAGVTHMGGGSGEEVEVQVFLRIDKPHLEVKLAAAEGRGRYHHRHRPGAAGRFAHA